MAKLSKAIPKVFKSMELNPIKYRVPSINKISPPYAKFYVTNGGVEKVPSYCGHPILWLRIIFKGLVISFWTKGPTYSSRAI